MTPALDALLKEVEAMAPWQDVTGAPFVPIAPRLAAMLRVAVEVMQMIPTTHAGWRMSQDALARIEALAKGEA